MELKYLTMGRNGGDIKSSNRTFMELKYESDRKKALSVICSNRTFMELKCRMDLQFFLPFYVLIVPLWN